jgi:hypothetical protein
MILIQHLRLNTLCLGLVEVTGSLGVHTVYTSGFAGRHSQPRQNEETGIAHKERTPDARLYICDLALSLFRQDRKSQARRAIGIIFPSDMQGVGKVFLSLNFHCLEESL